jgi:hypothetical protein
MTDKIRFRECDFRYENFVCILPRGHLSDHKDKEGFAMFNIDAYASRKGAKP